MSLTLDCFSLRGIAGEEVNFEPRIADLTGRRRFLSTLGAVGTVAGAAVLTGSMVGCSNDGAITSPTVTPSILDVLNFALNLEYLEASFYAYVTTGGGLPSADMGSNPGTVTGGAQVAFTNPEVASLAAQLASDEAKHVAFLRSTISSIGGTPVAMPSLNLAAGGTVNSDVTFLAAARQLEAVGVSAYIGGAQYLTASTTALTYAAQILDTESQHAGFIRELCIALGVRLVEIGRYLVARPMRRSRRNECRRSVRLRR